MGVGGGSKEQEVPSSQQPYSVLGGGGRLGLRRPYGDSLHWAKFEDKELLISNKAEYLSVMK